MELRLKICIILYTVILIQCVSSALCIYFNSKKTPTLYSLLSCYTLIALWLFFGIVENISTSTSELLFTLRFSLFPVYYLGSACLILVLFITEYISLKNKKLLYLLLVPPTICYLPVFTNRFFYLVVKKKVTEDPFNTTWGILFWINYIFTFCYIVSAILILILKSYKKHKSLTKKYFLFALATAISFFVHIITHILVYSGIIPSLPFDFTPVSFSILLMLYSISIFRYKLLEIMPFATHELYKNLNESVIIVDNANNIVDYNPSAVNSFGNIVDIRNSKTLSTFINSLNPFVESKQMVISLINDINNQRLAFRHDITINPGTKKYFTIFSIPVKTNKNKILGRIISIHDITIYKELQKKLEKSNYDLNERNEELYSLNEELTALNEQLVDYSETVEKLTIEKERTRFARNMHDSIGNHLVVIKKSLEHAIRQYNEPNKQALKKTVYSYRIAKYAMEDLRRVVKGLSLKTLEENDLISAMNELIKKCTSSGININFSHKGIDDKIKNDKMLTEDIYNICQEALTNSIKHGKAQNVAIVLNYSDNSLHLYIIDDGIGCDNVIQNKGIAGMEEKIEAYGGNILFGSGDDGGFNIKAVIPLPKVERYKYD